MKSKKEKHEEAVERNTHYSTLSNAEKIALLDKKLGKNKGAKKQRNKLKNE